MRITVNWLRELVDTELDAADIAERLTAAGLEVERVEERGRDLDGIVVGEIVKVDPHPRADRLVLCEVRTGGGGARHVVCGARNMQAGDRVALATVGAQLPDGRRIDAAEIRGVRSEGMLCSASELQLGEESGGILILGSGTEVGRPLAEALGIADTVIEVAPTPNRGDCLSVLGIARELAAITGASLSRRRPTLREKGAVVTDIVSVRILDPELCGRYAARVVADVAVGPSPDWLQQRLLAVGMRPINNVVDVTNFVMVERGQPLHAFDMDRLPGTEIVVRRAGTACEFVTLDGAVRRLDADDLVIAAGTEPVAIAGVMGGNKSGVEADTRRVLLESAWFHPSAVRRTARRLGVSTESAYRFERTVDIEGATGALDRAASLLSKLAGGSVARGTIDVYPRPRQAVSIPLRVSRAQELLGVELDRGRVAAALKALGASVGAGSRGVLAVEPPSYRSDLTREIDLVEEVARLIGYHEIPATLPVSTLAPGDEGAARPRWREIRQLLAGMGWAEAVSLSFTSARFNQVLPGLAPEGVTPATPLNPLSQENAQMRLSLLSGLVEAARHNVNQGERSVALYGIGKVFWQRGESYGESHRLAGILLGFVPRRGVGEAHTPSEFVDLKGALEAVVEHFGVEVEWRCPKEAAFLHPGTSAELMVGDARLGIAGGLHPELQDEIGLPAPCWLFELDAQMLLQYCRARVFKELPRFPAVVRDLAIVADEDFVAEEVIRFIRRWRSEWIEAVELFDQYRGTQIPPNKKSLAYSITYRAQDRTLTDDEVNALHEQLTVALGQALRIDPRR